MPVTNAWGDPVPAELSDDPWTVPADQRVDHDDDPNANALGATSVDPAEFGDDLDGWQRGDPT